MRALILAALCAALAACAKTPPPAIEVRVERVDVPVAVACIDKASLPAMPAQIGDKLTGNAAADAATLATSSLELRAALTRALALMQGCVR